MTSQSRDDPLVTFSVGVYRFLLKAYPSRFRRKYGPDMLQVFQDCCRRTFHQSGEIGVIELWAMTLFDLARSLIEEHTQKEAGMTGSNFVRLSGWALIGGAAAFAIGMLSLGIGSYTGDALSGVLVLLVLPPLLVVGLLGVRNRYGDRAGGLGNTILLAGAILGPLATWIGIFGMLGLFENQSAGWVLAYSGPAVSFACLTLFGLVALYVKPLPRWNVLPVLAGIWYPAIVFYLRVLSSDGSPNGVSAILIIIQSIALAALGYMLRSDLPQETATLA